MNKKILEAIISTNLHISAEHTPLTYEEITATAISLRDALATLYPVTDKEWESILWGIGKYADCLV